MTVSAYAERRPPASLASHACCIWTHAAGASGHVQRVLPDGCADIVWLGERLVVAGPATVHVLAHIPPGATALGVRFGPGAAGAALGLPAAELQNRTVDLTELWGPVAFAVAERLASVPPSHGLALLVAAVAERVRGAAPPDAVVAHAARLLGAGLPLAETGREIAFGERHLRRRFHQAVGYGPKTLQRILRLRRFLALAEGAAPPVAGVARSASANVAPPDLARAAPPDLARAAVEVGYFDQSHLTRECTDLAGLPPAALLASRQPRAAADGVFLAAA